MATFAVPNQVATTPSNLIVTDTTGYPQQSNPALGAPVAQATVPVTPGVPVVQGNGIETGLNRSEQLTQLPGFPINVGTST